MRILVTNDDGIESAGLHALADRFTELGEVTVFAPTGEYSGAGASIGHLGPGLPDVHRGDRPELASVGDAYHTDGPPALCTLLACQGMFGDRPELVVSGINPGWNVGHSVHFSGTVGAGITARAFGVPAIAVSQPTGGTQRWDCAAEVAARLVPELLADPGLLNVNVPNRGHSELKGSKYTALSDRLPYSLHAPVLTEREPGVFAADFRRSGPFDSFVGSDTHAVEAGYVSITRLAPTRAAD